MIGTRQMSLVEVLSQASNVQSLSSRTALLNHSTNSQNPYAGVLVVIHSIVLPLPTAQFAYPYAFNHNHLGSFNVAVSMELIAFGPLLMELPYESSCRNFNIQLQPDVIRKAVNTTRSTKPFKRNLPQKSLNTTRSTRVFKRNLPQKQLVMS